MKIAILGGRGYLGWQLYQFLKKKYNCVCVNRVGHSYDYKKLNEKIKDSNVIIFLAGPNLKKINNKSVFDRLTILKKIGNKIVKNRILIYFSTTAKFSRNQNKKNYIISHRLAEKYLIQNINKNNFKIIKLSNVFGLNFLPKENNLESSPINFFINKIIKNENIKLKTPHARRNWLPISNFLELNDKIIQKRKNFKLKVKKITVNQFINKIYYLKNKSKSNNIFDREILKTIKILKNYNKKC